MNIFKVSRSSILLYIILFVTMILFLVVKESIYSTIAKYYGDEKQFEVVPNTISLGIISFNKPKFLGGGSLNERSVKGLQSIDGVGKVVPVYVLKAPAHISGDLGGNYYGTDLAIFGRDFGGDGRGEEPIEIYCSSKLMDFYNLGFSVAAQLPGLNDSAVKGMLLDLSVGRNSFKGLKGSRSYRTVIKDLRDDVDLLGVTMDIKDLRTIAKRGKFSLEISKIEFVVKAGYDQSEVLDRVKAKGLAIGGEDSIIAKVRGNRTLITIILQIPTILIFIIIILFTLLLRRANLLLQKREILMLNVLGMRDRSLIFMVVRKAGVTLFISILTAFIILIISKIIALPYILEGFPLLSYSYDLWDILIGVGVVIFSALIQEVIITKHFLKKFKVTDLR